MNRREMVRLLSGALAAPLAAGLPAERLAALGRSVHARARGRALQVLDPHQSETVATIAEMIIPATDTPGARAARVHEFIDLILAEWDGDDDRARFLSGLADVDTRCRDAFGADFLGAAAAQRSAVLAGLDAEVTALRAAPEDAGARGGRPDRPGARLRRARAAVGDEVPRPRGPQGARARSLHPAPLLRLRRVQREVLRERPRQPLRHRPRRAVLLDPRAPGGRALHHVGPSGVPLERPRLRGEREGRHRDRLADPLRGRRAVVRPRGALHRR